MTFSRKESKSGEKRVAEPVGTMTGSDDRQASASARPSAPEKAQAQDDPLYLMLKPLHHLPMGKNAWNPQFIRKWWFWPASAAALFVLSYLYPYLWDLFAR